MGNILSVGIGKCKTKSQKIRASAGSRTRVDCLEGNHANRYTTDACRIHIGLKLLNIKLYNFNPYKLLKYRLKYV